MVIREAQTEDARAMGIVHVDTWRTTYPGIVADSYLNSLSHEASAAKWHHRLTNPELGRFYFVAEEDDGRIVGIVEGGLNEDQEFPTYEGQVYTLYILRGCQGRGIGRMLMQAAARRFRDCGIEDMMVWVLTVNPSRGFYERMGGRFLGVNMLNVHGQELEESAYGWDDLSVILDSDE